MCVCVWGGGGGGRVGCKCTTSSSITSFVLSAFALVTSDISKIGVFVSFLECTFEGNSAMEAGGALGVGFTLPMANQLGTRPLEIRDWYV